MTIKFESHMEKALLVNAFIFAQHKREDIAKTRALRESVAEQMEEENRAWFEARRKLADCGLEVEL